MGVEGNANLFLLNPNGILFGKNAQLDVRGSFAGTTANAISFGNQGIFSATNPQAPPLLTINPSALLFNQMNPGAIAIQSKGLLVPQGENLLLVGGNVMLDGGQVIAQGGRIELAGLAGNGAVELTSNGNALQLNFPSGVPRADVVLQNNAFALTRGGGVAVHASNLNLFGNSYIATVLQAGEGTPGSRAGNVAINATGAVTLDSSSIANYGFDNSLGDSGNVDINAQSIRLTNQSRIVTGGERNRGNIRLNVTEDVTLDGNSFLATFGTPDSIGDSGDITVNARNINLSNRGDINSSNIGQGRGGQTTLRAQNAISLSGGSGIFSNSNASIFGGVSNFPSGNIEIRARALTLNDPYTTIASRSYQGGRPGNIRITTNEAIALNNYSSISSSTNGQADAGNIQLQTLRLELSNGALIDTITSGPGNSGNLLVNAKESVIIRGSTVLNSPPGEPIPIYSNLSTQSFGSGNAGQITIDTHYLSVQDGGDINAGTGIGSSAQGGDITVRTTDAIEVFGVSPDGSFPSRITSNTSGSGNAGNLTLATRRLSIREGGLVSTAAVTGSSGQGGKLTVNASEAVEVLGTTLEGSRFTNLSTATLGSGNAGNLTINTGSLSIRDGAVVDTSARANSTGLGGDLTVNASDSVEVVGASLDDQFDSVVSTVTTGPGNAGRLTIDTRRLSIRNGASIKASTGGSGRGGDLIINAADSLEILANPADTDLADGLFTSTGGSGNAGNLTLRTQRLSVRNGGVVSAATAPGSMGRGGNVTINASDLVEVVGTSNDGRLQSSVSVRSRGSGQAGNITVNTPRFTLKDRGVVAAESNTADGGNINLTLSQLLLLRRNSAISATAAADEGAGNGGNITLSAPFIVAVPSENSDIIANAFTGNGGNIQIATSGIFGTQFREDSTPQSDISASSEFGLQGTVEINTPDLDPSQGLVALPVELVDASGLIASGCGSGRRQGESKFIVTGRGGLPMRPQDAEISPYPTGTVRSIPSSERSSETTRSSVSGSIPFTHPTSPAPTPIVEAQGWVINNKGLVVLTATAPPVTSDSPWIPSTCYGS